MTSHNLRLLFMALSLVALGCANTTLQVPNNGAANPSAPTMPVAQNESALAEDFDPWADDADAASDPHAHHHDAHAHHHQPMTEPVPTPSPSAPSNASGYEHQHEAHDHE